MFNVASGRPFVIFELQAPPFYMVQFPISIRYYKQKINAHYNKLIEFYLISCQADFHENPLYLHLLPKIADSISEIR